MMKTSNAGPAKVWAAPTMQVVVMSAAKNGELGVNDGGGINLNS